MEFSYLNKRDKKNRLLWFNAYELNFKIVLEATKIIFQKNINHNYTDFDKHKLYKVYIEKLLFYDFLEISHKINIINHDQQSNDNITNIYSSKYICIELLNKVFHNLGLKFKVKNTKKNIVLNELKNIFFLFSEKIYKNIFFKKVRLSNNNLKNKNKNIKIGVNYSDGINDNKRSDLFFLKDETLKENILLYFEYPELKKKHMHELDLKKKLKNDLIKTIDLWKWKQNEFYYEVKNFNKIKNRIDKWIYFENLKFIRQLNFWQNFFLINNIKIHLDPSEYGNTNVIKQVALESINGVSIGKLRSYPSDLKGIFYHYYPNDVFFSWGEDSKIKLESTKNNIKNILISGYPYKIKNDITESKLLNKFNKKIKFKLLLIDNSHGENLHISQNIYTKDLEKFYLEILSLCDVNENIGLIIKPKRLNEFENLKNLNLLLQKLKKENKCIVIEDAYQAQTINYSIISDLSIGIGNFASAAFLESIIYNKGIFYDYGNIYIEDKIYNTYLNKLIFNDLKILISELKTNIDNNFNNKNFGDWHKFNNKIDKYRDKLGHERIGEYIFNLKKKLDMNFSSEKSVKEANEEYIKRWY